MNKRKFVQDTHVRAEAFGFLVSIRRYWRHEDGRIHYQVRNYHTSVERGSFVDVTAHRMMIR
jgi:hypothetical protein